MDIPFELKQAIETGSAILFIGAGIGHNMVNEDGMPLPDGKQLAKLIANKFSVPIENDQYDLALISQYVAIEYNSKKELDAFIKAELISASPDEYMSWIPTIKWKAIFTTNYDHAIETAYDQCPSPAQEYTTITHISGYKDFIEGICVPIIHLHGSLFDEASPDIIITQQDYVKYKNKRQSLFNILKNKMALSCILYVGYSNSDSNWNTILNDIEEELYPDKPTKSFRIDPFTSEINKKILKNRSIETIDSTFTDFVKEARIQIESKELNSSTFKIFEKSIPEAFGQSFLENPTSTIRLFKSWEYVNAISTAGKKDTTYEFLRGNKADWGLIFKSNYFQREIEDEVYSLLLDYATDPKRIVSTCIVCGPAGYGISTLLMSLAKRLLKDGAGMVFYHRHPTELREGDIFYSTSINIKENHFYFIDNASDYADIIKGIIHHAREAKQRIILVLGDRTNELNQAQMRITPDVFIVPPLSDSEIEKLLDYLKEKNELNKLEYLDRDLQVAAIKKNYLRELLVVIREATDGRDFDAIIADEYFNIKDPFCRKVYSIVSCFYLHSSLLRADLLASLLGVSLTDYYAKVSNLLEGVIYYECINQNTNEYAMRARHRLISNIVWNRCIDKSEKDEIIHSSLSKMNIAYRIDKQAFDNFIKSDHVVDSLISIDSKTEFFEKACKMDPDNPYVRQHYARMLVRENRFDIALAIIEVAIRMDKTIRILYHTKGYVLSNMAMSTESIEIARRRVGQSEDSYRYGLGIKKSDEYCYQGLAQLYLGWAKRCEDEQERLLYLSKAEDIISEGLRNVRDKDTLWVEASKIDEYVGDSEAQITNLKRAIKESKNNTIAQYLLAKAYKKCGELEKSQEILKELLLEKPDEYRTAMTYAEVLIMGKKPLDIAISVMNQSTLFGYSDAKFVTMLAALLFINKKYTEAESVFEETVKRNFSNANSILFYPFKYGIETKFEAKVQYIGVGYSLLSVKGFPDIFCPGSKYNGIILRVGMKVAVEIVFSPRRPIALIEYEIK